jgi:hypothetical protein
MTDRPDLRPLPGFPRRADPSDYETRDPRSDVPRWRRGSVAALAGLCLLLGVVGGAVAANTASEPSATSTVTASPAIRVETITKAPRACVDAISGVAKVSVRQFKIIDLYREALNHANVAAWNEADRLYFHMTDGTANVKHAANVCVKAAGG